MNLKRKSSTKNPKMVYQKLETLDIKKRCHHCDEEEDRLKLNRNQNAK